MLRGSLFAVVVAGLVGCSLGTDDSVDGSAPQVAIATPAAGATVGGQVRIEVLAIDDAGVDKVRILVDGTLLAEVFTQPYIATWNTSQITNGSNHTIRAEASDAAKNTSISQITVTVDNSKQ